MNGENLVRVHLREAVLVGYGREARYAKVLCGKHEPMVDARYSGVPFLSMVVIGYVRNYQGVNLAEPTRALLAVSNILSIEDAKVERPAPHYMRRAACEASVYHGTPESLWSGPGQRQIRLREVDRARRIIQLCDDGTYRIVKNMEDVDFDPKNEVIFLYDEEKGD